MPSWQGIREQPRNSTSTCERYFGITNPESRGQLIESENADGFTFRLHPPPARLIRRKASHYSGSRFASLKLQRHQLSTNIFDDWLKDIPEVAGSVKVEAAFWHRVHLLVLTVPLALWAYFPEHEAIVARELLQSRNPLLFGAASNGAAGRESTLGLHDTEQANLDPEKDDFRKEAIDDGCLKDEHQIITLIEDSSVPGALAALDINLVLL